MFRQCAALRSDSVPALNNLTHVRERARDTPQHLNHRRHRCRLGALQPRPPKPRIRSPTVITRDLAVHDLQVELQQSRWEAAAAAAEQALVLDASNAKALFR